jgi:TolB-like protein
LCVFWVLRPFPVRGAQPQPVRLAIGPFFGPAANDELRQAAQLIPELLAADLSHVTRYQLVEREKIQTVWNEMHLGASGLVARDTVTRLGSILACDWVISGSLVQAGGKTHVWTKVIDVRDGVIVDLNDTAYEAGVVTNVAARIAAFLEQAGSQPRGRQFITMGPFVDMNPPLGPKREDWSRRLSVLMEKSFVESGFGVTEMAAIGPIFEERRLETAGLTGHPEGRVKLQPAFWIVDGGCEWVEEQPLKLAVGLRVQRIGGVEQMFRFTNAPGEAVEKELLATLTRAMANTNALSNAGPNAESELLTARGKELAERNSPFRSGISRRRTQWDAYKEEIAQRKKFLENRPAILANYERTLLRDPKNLEAKNMLGYALLLDPDPTKRGHGQELMREIIATRDPKYVDRATRHLTNAAAYSRAADESARTPRRPDDWQSVNQAFNEDPSDLESRCDLGAALLRLPRVSNRKRGRELLAEVAAGNRADQAERARTLLAAPEKYPAIPDEVRRPPASDQSPKAGAEGGPGSEVTLQPENELNRMQREFLQAQFDKFVPVRFEKDGSDLAKFQRVPAKDKMFDYQGKHYCGVRFTVPEWADGDFDWMYLLAKSEAQKDFRAATLQCRIISKSGRVNGFGRFNVHNVASYTEMPQHFPYTVQFLHQTLSKAQLNPGQEYAIWFCFEEDNFPDIAFAMTIQSQRGRAQIGILPLR